MRKLRDALDGEAIGVLRQARFAIEQVWQRLSSHCPSPEIATSVEELKTLLGSDQFIDSWSEIKTKISDITAAYKQVYLELFDRRRAAYLNAIAEIKLRPEWEPLQPVVKEVSDEVARKQLEAENAKKQIMANTMLALFSFGSGQTKIGRTSVAGRRSERQASRRWKRTWSR